MAGSTRSRPRYSGEDGLFSLPRLRGRAGWGAGRESVPWNRPHPDPPRRRGGRRKRLPAHCHFAIAIGIAAAPISAVAPLKADAAIRPYAVIGDAIPASLTGAPGDPARGKAIVASRQTGLCLLCHSAPLPEEKFQGTIGPGLKGIGARYTEGELRLRIVDPRISNPDTIMPAYYRLDGLERVAPAFRGKTVLTAEQIEDVVAFLMTLHD